MPLQPLSVPAQSNSFITAFTLCVLLPTLDNDELFDATRISLFGEISGRLTAGIINELEHANLNQFPTLIALLQSHLRPRLVTYANLHNKKYQSFFDSQEAFRSRLGLLGRADSPSDEFEQKILSDYLNVRIEIIQELYPEPGNPDTAPNLYFSIRNGLYYYFVESDVLPESLRRELFPLVPAPISETVDLVQFQEAKSKNLLQDMFQIVSDENQHLDNLSKNADIMQPTGSALSPADIKFVLRFNLETELRTLRTVVKQVQLTHSYDIIPVPREGCTQQKIIYANIGQTGFDYTICGETGATTTAFLEYGELEDNEARFQHPVTIEQLRSFLPKIQKKLEDREHIVVVKAQIGGPWSWAGSMVKSGGVGLTAGAAAVGAVTMGEIAGAGIGIALIPYAGIPLAVGFFVAIMGASWWGKSCAVEYEKALDTVNQLLSRELYDEAAELLDRQLQQWSLGTRELFLTKQHETLMHFFVASCARKMGNLQKAYDHFILTYKAAQSIEKKSAAFIAKLQLLELLKNSLPEQVFTVKVSESILFTRDQELNRQEEAEKIVEELTKEFTEGFTEYYWYIIERLQDWSLRFKSLHLLTEAEMTIDRRNIIDEANLFLMADNFFILKAYANGYGAFLEVVSTFYQGAILDYFGHVNSDYLEPDVKHMLVFKFLNGNTPERNVERTLALKRFEHASILLRDYKSKYPEMRRNQTISATINLMESFILKFYATWVDGRSLRIEAFLNIANILGKEQTISNGIYQDIRVPIDFLARVQRDFGIFFDNEEQWLDELLRNASQIAHLVSERTGDTMLHLLTCFQTRDVRLVEKVQAGALKLQGYRYRRNYNHEIPLLVLKDSDPLRLIPILCPNELIFIGGELQRADDFLNSIKEKILSHVDNYLATKTSIKRDKYRPNVVGSLERIFERGEFRQVLLSHHRDIPEQNIPRLREKEEYLIALITYDAARIQEMYQPVKEDTGYSNQLAFAQNVAAYIEHCWSALVVTKDITGETAEEKSMLVTLSARMRNCFQNYKPTLRGETYSVVGKNQQRLTAVLSSLELGVFGDPKRRAEILGFYRSIHDVPSGEQKDLYLLNVIKLDEQKVEALYKLGMNAPQEPHSQFATDMVQYIKDYWKPLFPKNMMAHGHVLTLDHSGLFATDSGIRYQDKIRQVDQKMTVFKSAFIHFIEKTYRLFYVLLNEEVQSTKENAMEKVSSIIRSTEITTGVNIPFIGGIEINIPSVVAGIIDLFVMVNSYLDKQRMKRWCDVFPEDETQRFNAITEAALKLAVELSPELYHMPDMSVTVLAELAIKRIIHYATSNEQHAYSEYPGYFERVRTSLPNTSQTTTPMKRKTVVELCQIGMRTSMGRTEHNKLSQQVGVHDTPTYQAILDHSGWVIVQEGKPFAFVHPKYGASAFCVKQGPVDKSVASSKRSIIPERLRSTLDVCVDVYQAEINNSDPIIPGNIFSYRRQQHAISTAKQEISSDKDTRGQKCG
ncbi:MAG: hypothetical protein NXI01_02410 [Gammaproteobacteria bacterium]|nr:hypothetical protein [Gammaproteobacteria bacterium]